MRLWLLTAFILFGLASCNKEKFEKELEGNYTGIFYRTAPHVNFPVQQVTLNLNDNIFSGASSNARYPAICHGNWEAGNSTIEFENRCVWTADFDWSLILDGEFRYEWNGTQLKLWQVKGESEVTDWYVLEKVQ